MDVPTVESMPGEPEGYAAGRWARTQLPRASLPPVHLEKEWHFRGIVNPAQDREGFSVMHWLQDR